MSTRMTAASSMLITANLITPPSRLASRSNVDENVGEDALNALESDDSIPPHSDVALIPGKLLPLLDVNTNAKCSPLMFTVADDVPARGSDSTYSGSMASGSEEEDKDSPADNADNASSEILAPETPSERLFRDAARGYHRLKCQTVQKVRRYERIKKLHATRLEESAALGEQKQKLEVELDHSNILLDELRAGITLFISQLPGTSGK